jgi:hypothetical protein
MRPSVVIAAIVAFGLFVGFHVNVPAEQPLVCVDGWKSPSIGRQGACSSHGGVDRDTSTGRAESQNGWLGAGGGLVFLVTMGWMEIRLKKRGKLPWWGANSKELVSYAIRAGRGIQFQYPKDLLDGKVTELHTMTPERFDDAQIRRGGTILYVVGYSDYHKKTWKYVVSVMTNVKVLEI